MKLLLSIVLLISLSIQDKPKEVKEEVIKARPELQASILREQLSQERIQKEYTSCQARNWVGEYKTRQVNVDALVEQAFKDAKLDKKDYDLNLDTFIFVKKVTEPIAPVKEPAKKP